MNAEFEKDLRTLLRRENSPAVANLVMLGNECFHEIDHLRGAIEEAYEEFGRICERSTPGPDEDIHEMMANLKAYI